MPGILNTSSLIVEIAPSVNIINIPLQMSDRIKKLSPKARNSSSKKSKKPNHINSNCVFELGYYVTIDDPKPSKKKLNKKNSAVKKDQESFPLSLSTTTLPQSEEDEFTDASLFSSASSSSLTQYDSDSYHTIYTGVDPIDRLLFSALSDVQWNMLVQDSMNDMDWYDQNEYKYNEKQLSQEELQILEVLA